MKEDSSPQGGWVVKKSNFWEEGGWETLGVVVGSEQVGSRKGPITVGLRSPGS